MKVVARTIALATLLTGAGLVPLMAQAGPVMPDWELPRTAWGHPDIQGNWTNMTLTPFSRPSGQGPVLTPEQVQEIEGRQAAAIEERVNSVSDPDRPPPPGGDDPVCIDGATTCYNEAYRAPGETVAWIDGEPRSSIVRVPANGRVPAITEEARRRIGEWNAGRASFAQYDHPELRPLAERCIVSFGSSAGPPMLPNYWYNNNYTIVQNEDHIMFLAEMVHDVRIVQLTEAPIDGAAGAPWFGDSRGYWDGNTLVVETRNLNPEHWFRGAPPSEERVVTERFTRVSDDQIVYSFMIDDPVIYAEAWGGELPFRKLEEQVYEYACHEGNYALTNVLSGARYQEREGSGNR